MVMPYPQDMDAPVWEVSFLGGLLHGYRREGSPREEMEFLQPRYARERKSGV